MICSYQSLLLNISIDDSFIHTKMMLIPVYFKIIDEEGEESLIDFKHLKDVEIVDLRSEKYSNLIIYEPYCRIHL